jgi:membrane protein YqaA with SNARE-associated domain
MSNILFSWTFGRLVSNFLGGTIRWFIGTIWRTILKKPKFTYKEYLFGPKDSTSHYDIHGHQFNNIVIYILL